jgi:arginase
VELRIIAVPYDTAIRDWRMGAGPDRLLECGLEDHLQGAGHRVTVERIELPHDEPTAEISTAFDLAARLRDRVRAARSAGELPIVLAGNCGTALGTLAALAEAEPGVVWLDAHGDLNTPETTGSGFMDGMALATATGRCWKRLAAAIPGFRPMPDDRVVLLGARNLDVAEAEVIGASAITHVQPARVDDGLSSALDTLRQRTTTVYLHIDLDVLDPSVARANTYAAEGGLSLAQAEAVVHAVGTRFELGAIALTAYDPSCDPDGRVPHAAFALLDAALQTGRGRQSLLTRNPVSS